MVKIEDIFKLEFYKKLTPFYGSIDGVRYRIAKEPMTKDAEDPKLMATCWNEPYNYDVTPKEEMISEMFSFDEAGMQEAVDWINTVYSNKLLKTVVDK